MKEHNKRPIYTAYMDTKGKLVKVNFSLHPESAVLNAVGYMQRDYYKAHMVEVYDSATGIVHAVIKWRNKTLTIVYTRDPKIVL
jgi:hypothetical protein